MTPTRRLSGPQHGIENGGAGQKHAETYRLDQLADHLRGPQSYLREDLRSAGADLSGRVLQHIGGQLECHDGQLIGRKRGLQTVPGTKTKRLCGTKRGRNLSRTRVGELTRIMGPQSSQTVSGGTTRNNNATATNSVSTCGLRG